jgi:integrase/recombinase XerC
MKPHALVPVTRVPITVPVPPDDLRMVMDAIGQYHKPKTRDAYARDWKHFAAHYAPGVDTYEALKVFLDRGHGAANVAAIEYIAWMRDVKKYAPNTINRRLAALKAFVFLARTIDKITWSIEARGVKAVPYRDTRGPGTAAVQKMIECAAALGKRSKAWAARDVCIIRLLHDLALRRFEVAGLSCDDVDVDNKRLSVLGKGRAEREWLTMPDTLVNAIAVWMRCRGGRRGPLFCRVILPHFKNYRGDPIFRWNDRITDDGIERVVKRLAKMAGLKAMPHGLRHTAVTEALNATNGDYRKVAAFSRHRDIRTVMRYDDQRLDAQGDVATLVSKSIQGGAQS